MSFCGHTNFFLKQDLVPRLVKFGISGRLHVGSLAASVSRGSCVLVRQGVLVS